jgi:hypothetical protein
MIPGNPKSASATPQASGFQVCDAICVPIITVPNNA